MLLSKARVVSEDTDIELQLLCLVRQGDAMAARTVYSTYIRYLAAVCSRYIINNEDVKDVLQESFLKIFSGIASFEYKGKGSLKGWITRITVNEALKFLQKNNRFEFVEISEQVHDKPDDEPDIDALPASVLFNLIRELPDGYRTIFNLYVIENRSHKEIARLLGIKESTSASQLHRAKSMLAMKIRQYSSKYSFSYE
ncbi:MAG: sigma-70 family RNA polymerase sigma factor [Muribaculaceae bacterium]|nr:sigma-70 family RNA polymerase sigma factor [Muribaculaceae bacterium]